MNRRRLLVAAGASVSAFAQATERDKLIGTWRLRSNVRTFNDGRIEHPYGQQPIGRIQYEKSGRMMAIIMRPNRTSTIKPQETLSAAGCEEVREAVAGFIGYFGTFILNASAKTVTHRVEASLVPNGINTELIRGFRFDGDLLVLHRRSADGAQSDELVWERESD